MLVNDSMYGIIKAFKYDLKMYNVFYFTADAKNNIVKASGVIIMPSNPIESPASLLSYQHGTMLQKIEPFTVSSGAEAGFAAALASASWSVVLVPDHLGLGAAALGQVELIHPYCQWESNARTDGDMIKAVKTLFQSPKFKEEKPPALNNRLLLTGYSEGGYLTLGLHRELEANPEHYGLESNSPVTASAPMEGPYSLSDVMVGTLLADTEFPAPYFAPYLLVTYNNNYDVYKTPGEYLKPPYDTTLPRLFNGFYSSDDVNSAMPKVVKNILSADVLSKFKVKKGPFALVLKKNDLADPPLDTEYTLKSPVLLVHGNGDELVPYNNGQKAYDYFIYMKKANVFGKPLPITTEMRTFKKLANTPFHASFAPYAVQAAWEWLNAQDHAACFFEWAENSYSHLFSTNQGKATTQFSSQWIYRYYPGSDTYLGGSTEDGHVYYMENGVMHDAGSIDDALATAHCP